MITCYITFHSVSSIKPRNVSLKYLSPLVWWIMITHHIIILVKNLFLLCAQVSRLNFKEEKLLLRVRLLCITVKQLKRERKGYKMTWECSVFATFFFSCTSHLFHRRFQLYCSEQRREKSFLHQAFTTPQLLSPVTTLKIKKLTHHALNVLLQQ